MDLEQLEAFALAEDREAALAQLVPGTQEYYFLHCLHYQHVGDLARSFELLERWIQRHGHTSQARGVSHRQTLLSWPHDPQGCVDYLRQVLGLHFDHARELAAEKRALPTQVDPRRLDRAALMQRALDEHRDLTGFTDAALEWLAAAWQSLDASQRHQLLSRLQRPDQPDMVALVLADLARPRAEAFGSLPIHQRLLLAQLDELAEKRPALREVPQFVHTYLERLQPGPAEDLARDPGRKRAYLERLWTFVSGLAPVFASLQAHVLYHWLVLDRAEGQYDRERFLAYLRLPRLVSYVPEAYLAEHEKRVANLHERFPTGLDPVGDDESLVRDYLAHLLVDADGYEELAAYVREDVLRQIFATAKILAGNGDGERWYALLDDPGYYQALKERVDIELAPTNPRWFGAGEPVALDVDIKNVPTLVIKIYEIDTLGYYTKEDREIDTDIDLDGLPASQEQVHTYEEPALVRRRRRFELDALARPGIYVIDFIGNGKSSRALVRKGRLGYVERHGAAGHVLTVLDEDGRAVRDASVWLGGREYTTREDGTILIPYSTKPGLRSILLRHGDLTVRERLQHLAERYDFSAGFYVEREALVPGNTAEVVVRPRLGVHGTPVSLSLLSSPVLVVSTTDRHGVRTSKEVTDFAVHEDRESIHGFRVPADLTEVRLALRAKIRSVSEQRDIELVAEAHYDVNGQDRSAAAEGLYLRRTEAGYVLELLGKSGEPRAGVALELTLQHRDFTRPVALDVQTDARGGVILGQLPDIVMVSARRSAGVDASSAAPAQWPIARDRVSVPRMLHIAAGEDIAIPYTRGSDQQSAEDRVSLLERAGNGYRADWGRACQLEGGEGGESGDDAGNAGNGYLRIQGLPAGDYELWLPRMGVKIDIRVAASPAERALPATDGKGATPASWLVDTARLLGRTPRTGLQITRVQALDEVVEIRLAGLTERTRVHVFGVRFVTPLDQASVLTPAGRPVPGVVTRARSVSHYVSGRRLGDEYRYVLERKQAEAFPGVMLERPRLLLNPWVVRKTETGEEQAREGSAYGAVGAPPPPPSAPAARPQPVALRPGGMDAASVDFVAAPASTQLNVRPERAGNAHEGVVRIARAALGHAQLVRVLAVDDGALVVRELGLPDSPGKYRDLRLMPGLDPQTHVVEKHRVSVLSVVSGAGAGLELANRTNARWEIYDTLRKVFELFAALSGNPTLSEFRFVLDWPQLSGAEKRERYSKYACHELHLFLSRKDPEFFAGVVQPYLRSKKDKTFLDHYLLGDDVSRYRELWAHGRLNAMERILLSQRLPGESEPGRRHIDDQCELIAPDPERDERLFRTALQRGALDSPPPAPMLGGSGGYGPRGGGGPRGQAAPAPAAMAAMAAPKKAARARSATASRADDTGGIAADMAFAKAELAEMDSDELADMMLAEESSGRDSDVKARGELRRLYRAADKTEEWAENNYYRLRVSEQGPGLIPVNAFWRDFAHHGGRAGQPFASAHVALATSSFAEMMCALAVLDLPFEASTPEVREQGPGLLVRTATPAIVFHEELATVAALPDESPVQVQQHYLRLDDRFDYESGEPRAKYATGALFTRTVYVCEVVLGNVTPAPLDVVLLWQIPAGAMAVGDGFATRSQRLRLDAYQTRSLEYCFYFPAPGSYTHFPVHVARGESPVAAAVPRVLTVVDPVDEADTSSWAYVSQHGASAAVVAFLESHNVQRLDLSWIAWRMEDRDFYDAVLAHLDGRRLYERTLWSYALAHRDAPRIATFLHHEEAFLRECGPVFRSPLVKVEPVTRGWYEHLEYAPLIHARAHELGGQRKILNQALAAQYRRFLDVLASQAALSDDDLLAAAYYLLLLDRVADGLAMFERVDGEAVAARLQYDYMAAVVALYRGDAGAARKVALEHAEHAVDRWRKRFAAVLGAVDEALGLAPGPATGGASKGDADEGAWLAEQGRLAESEQSFDIAVEGGAVVVSYQNLAQVEVRYYLMDIELAFSRAPFVSQATERFALVKPHGVDIVALPGDRRQHRFALPAAYARRNVVVEAIAAGTRKAQGHYAHDLVVHVAAPFGQVRVYEQAGGRPLPRSYVKVYARMRDGEVRFYKDGYTDLRGCFDYASLSTDALDRVARFSMLVISQEHGAMIREAAPPQQ